MILASIHPGTVYTKLSKPFIKEKIIAFLLMSLQKKF